MSRRTGFKINHIHSKLNKWTQIFQDILFLGTRTCLNQFKSLMLKNSMKQETVPNDGVEGNGLNSLIDFWVNLSNI